MDNKTVLSFWLSLAAIGVILLASSFLYMRFDSKNKSKGKTTEFSDKLLTFIFTVCIIAPFAAYLSLLIAKNIFTLFLVVVGETPDWLGFVGSIFGGFITLVAVIFTKAATQEEVGKQIKLLTGQLELMSAQNELIKRQHQEELEFKNREIALHAIPLLRVELIPDEGRSGVSIELTNDVNQILVPESLEGLLTFRIQNTSAYIARSLNITKFFVDRYYNEGFDENEPYIDYPPSHDDFTEEANFVMKEIPAIPGEYNMMKNFFFKVAVNKLSSMQITCELEYRDYNNTLSHKVQTTSNFYVNLKSEIHRNIDGDKVTEAMFTGLILEKQSESYLFIE